MIKTKWSDLAAFAAEQNLVWREQIKKDRWGPPISFERFRNPPYHAVYTTDRYSDVVNGKTVQVFGHMKLKRGRFWLCQA